jgi:hypothetical protein
MAEIISRFIRAGIVPVLLDQPEIAVDIDKPAATPS